MALTVHKFSKEIKTSSWCCDSHVIPDDQPCCWHLSLYAMSVRLAIRLQHLYGSSLLVINLITAAWLLISFLLAARTAPMLFVMLGGQARLLADLAAKQLHM
jgi:hypothetical protein